MQQELATARRPLWKRKIFVRRSTYEGDCEKAQTSRKCKLELQL